VTGDIALSYDQQSVIRSIRNLLLTNHYERPFNPDLGSNMNALLFEPISPMTSTQLEATIRTTINNYEPRAILKNITVQALPNQNAYNVTITFFLENATQATTISVILERNR
jgi:phage baseplate assembly protein W